MRQGGGGARAAAEDGDRAAYTLPIDKSAGAARRLRPAAAARARAAKQDPYNYFMFEVEAVKVKEAVANFGRIFHSLVICACVVAISLLEVRLHPLQLLDRLLHPQPHASELLQVEVGAPASRAAEATGCGATSRS